MVARGMCSIEEGFEGCSDCSMLGRDLVRFVSSEWCSGCDGLAKALAMAGLGSSVDGLWNGSKDRDLFEY